MSTPKFTMLWQNFPDHDKYPTLKELHKFIGGTLEKNIGTPGFPANGNTCAVRMSRALNYSFFPISSKVAKNLKIETMTGADGKLYIFRVRNLKTYLQQELDITPSRVTKNFATAFSGKRGIVCFDISGWSDASGHIALWDGSSFRETHDDYRNPPAPAKVDAMTLWAL